MSQPPEVASTWPVPDLLVLRAIVSARQSGRSAHAAVHEEVARLGLDRNESHLVVERLKGGRYIRTSGDPPFLVVEGATASALRETGAWPTAESELARLEAILDQAIADSSGERRTKLQAMRDGLLAGGRSIAIDVLDAYVRRTMGL